MKNLFLLLLSGVLVLSAAAQSGTEFEIESFDGIRVSHHFEVFLKQSNEYTVTAEAPKELMDKIHIGVKNNVLEVRMKDDYKKGNWWKKNEGEVRVHISFPSISELHISGAVKLAGVNTLDLDDLSIDASGASEIHLDVRGDEISLDLSGASEVTMKVMSDEFSLEASGASEVVLSGETDEFSIDCSGATEVDALEFKADEVAIQCSGASDIRIWATNEIEVDASGTSDIRYKCDNCSEVSVNASGASSVKKY